MADEKKNAAKENTSEAKAEKKSSSEKKGNPVANFFKKIGKGIKRFFKDLKGETKKIVWPGRQMVIKSTGVVLAAILVVGAGIWVIDFAISGAVTGINKTAENAQTTEAVSETEETEENAEDEKEEEETTEAAAE